MNDWDVSFSDDRGECHYVDFRTKSAAVTFCKAMVRMGAQNVCGAGGNRRYGYGTFFKDGKVVK